MYEHVLADGAGNSARNSAIIWRRGGRVRLPTIMTIMDRLARKGNVERRKVGRAYVYRPNLSAEEARVHALDQVIENFFAGSKECCWRN